MDFKQTDQQYQHVSRLLARYKKHYIRNLPVGIFFDLTKAYDVINHDILLEELEHYGIRGQINGWLKS
jgi:hypothetical protein